MLIVETLCRKFKLTSRKGRSGWTLERTWDNEDEQSFRKAEQFLLDSGWVRSDSLFEAHPVRRYTRDGATVTFFPHGPHFTVITDS